MPVVLCGVLFAGNVMAAIVGVNFYNPESGKADLVTGSAGVVAQTNWNNGTADWQGSGYAGSLSTVVDNTGAAVSGLAISWGPFHQRLNIGNTAALGYGDDRSLMHGGLQVGGSVFSSSANQITITGVSYETFDLYVYVNGWDTNPNRIGEAVLNVNGSDVAGTTIGFNPLGVDYTTGPHVRSISTSVSDEGTYILWTGLDRNTYSNVTVSFRNVGSENVMVTGLQIIPEPATLGMIVAVGGAALFIRRRKVM